MKYLFITVILCFTQWSMMAQKYTVSGQIQDVDQTNLIGAVVVALNPIDSVLMGYTVSNEDGKFTLPKLSKGSYNLQITYISYGTIERLITVEGSNTSFDLGLITMSQEGKLLDQVTISTDYIPIKITKDTIEFNADAFKTQPNALVEDLLKKLPGVEVDSDGGIKVQGEDVIAITVDGKDFFGKDPKMATRNLPADAIKKVQVFDKKSKTAEFTGVDDGQEEKTINLELKDNKKGGYFGNIMGGYGTDDRYEGKVMVNKFDKKSQISYIGSLNNLNNSGVNINDYASMTGASGNNFRNLNMNSGAPVSFGQSNTGEISSNTLGVNYNYDLSKKNKINASYFLTNGATDLIQSTYTNNFQQNRTLISNKALTSSATNLNHNFYTKLDLVIDSTSEVTVSGSLAIRSSDDNSFQQDTTSNEAFQILNLNIQEQQNKASSSAFSGQANYRKKLKKKGRSYTVDGSYGYSPSETLNDLISEVYDENAVLNITRSVFQFQNNNSGANNYAAGATYTEPLSSKWYWVSNVSTRNNRTDLIKDFYYLDPTTRTVGDLNTELSRRFDNTFIYYIAGTNLRYRGTNIASNIGVDLQQSSLEGIPSIGSLIDKNFTYLLPKASVAFDKLNLNVNYSTSIREPSIDQLQPIVDNTDPLNIYVGNPNLIPEYRHNMRIRYNFFDQFNFKALFANVRLGYTKNRITTSSYVDEFFVRQRTPLNTDYETSVSSNINYSSPLKFMKAKFRTSISSSLTSGINYVNNLPSNINRWTNSGFLMVENKSKDLIDASVSGRLSFTDNIYKDNEALNSSFINQTYEAYIALFAGKGWTIDSRYEYNIYGQGSFSGGSTKINLWQASVSKSLMKNKLALKLRAFDILNQNQGVNRSASETYITESVSNTIGRYVMLSVTYSLNALGAPAAPNVKMMRH